MTDWSQFTEYQCRHCRSRCINRRDSRAAQEGVCKYCRQNPVVLEDAKPPTGGNRFA